MLLMLLLLANTTAFVFHANFSLVVLDRLQKIKPSAAAKTQFKNIFCSIDGVCKSRPVNVNEVGEGAMTAKEVGARQANVVDVNVARSCIQEKEKRKSFSALSLFLSLFISVENEKVKVPSI